MAWRGRRLLEAVVAIALSATLAACGGGTVDLKVQLLRKSCPGKDGTSIDALQDVSHLEFIISGDGIDPPITTIAAVADGHVALEGIPLGEPGQVAERRIEVRAHFQSADGPTIARGLAVVMLDPSELHPPPIPVFLRPVDAFVYTADGSKPETCTQMNRARAGHTATTLNDGRVLIVGGAEFDSLGGRTVHNSAEIYDPFTGTFELRVAGSGGPSLPRVFHTASKLQDGRVLVVGGEFDKSANDRDVLKPAEIFRPTLDGFDATPLIANVGRAHHQATSVGDQVLITGGYADPNPAGGHPIPIKAVELFDGVAERFVLGPDLPEARAEHCAVALDNDIVVVAGGITGSAGSLQVSDTLHFYRVVDGQAVLLEQQGSPLTEKLSAARYGMGCAALRVGGNLGMVLAGGFTVIDDFSASSAHPGVEIFNPQASPKVQDAGNLGAGARGNGCALTLSDGASVLLLGGFNSGDAPSAHGADVISAKQSGLEIKASGRKMNDGRFLSACTRLLDGSVLVTGGLSPDAGGAPISVRTAELYTPIPR